MGRYVKINGELVPIAGIGGGGQDTNFKGKSMANWNALTQEEQDQYDTVDLTDDYTDVTDELETVSNSVNQMGEQVGDVTELVAALESQVATLQSQVAELTADTGWVTVSNNLRYRKKGNTVSVLVLTLKVSSWTSVGTLPAGTRPPVNLFLTGFANESTAVANAYIRTDGAVYVYGTNNSLYECFTYLV